MEKHPPETLRTPGARLKLVLEPSGGQMEIFDWSAALTDCRTRTLKVLAGMDQEALDWEPPFSPNTIGTLRPNNSGSI